MVGSCLPPILNSFIAWGGLGRVLRGFRQVSAKTTRQVAPDAFVALPKGFTWQYGKELGFKIALFRRYGEPASLRYFEEHRIDLAINLSGLYLPKKMLDAPRLAFQGGHYGALPELRGGDTVRWTIWKNQPLVISHMTLAPKMDMGDILRRKTLPVYRGETIDDLRKRCQIEAVKGHIECVRRWADKSITRQPQQEQDGQVYYLMGKRLIAKTDQLLKEQRYDHFAA